MLDEISWENFETSDMYVQGLPITKEMFEEYKNIQEEGLYNMLDPQARELSSLDRRQWYAIISNYKKLEEKFSA